MNETMKILILNGPNLNLLGLREPAIYGTQNYAALEAFCKDACREAGFDCEVFQSNHEGAIVDKIQQVKTDRSDRPEEDVKIVKVEVLD